MDNLAATKADADFDFVAIADKALDVAELDLIVAFFGGGAEFDFFDLGIFLVAARLLLFLFAFVQKAVVFHELGDRRVAVLVHQYQVQIAAVGLRERVSQRQNSQLTTIGSDHPQARCVDLLVNFVSFHLVNVLLINLVGR